MQHIKTFLAGALIGVANAIPGVSGGTMAVILNIYDKILYSVSIKNLKKNLIFLIPLGIGAVIAIFAFSKLVAPLMNRYPMILNFCFIGLIIGSIPAVYIRAKGEKAKIPNAIIGVLAFAFMVALSFMDGETLTNKSLAEFGGVSTVFCLWLFACALISTIAMILPGISGSLLLLLLGVYRVVIESISDMNIAVLTPVAIGVAAGLFIGIKVIKKMLRFHPQALYFGILGLIIGSIFTIYPGFVANREGIIALVLMVGFGLLAFFFSSRRK